MKLLMFFFLGSCERRLGREIDECIHKRDGEKIAIGWMTGLDGCILSCLASIGRGRGCLRFSACVFFLFIVSLFSFRLCLFRGL